MADAPRLARRLGTGDAVLIGLGSMLGAGVFAAFAPAADAAGTWLLAGLALAAGVAYCNATASAQLAAQYPTSGGTYVYGRERLGEWWGFLAGWGFVTGKTASCAAMALTFAAYAVPAAWQRPAAAAAVLLLAAVNARGITRTAGLTGVLVGVVMLALGVVVATSLGGATADPGRLTAWSDQPGGWYGVLQSAGLLFFAFAGYARIATMVASGGGDRAVPVVRIGAAAAALGALLALIAGVGRTTLAMARTGDLLRALAAVHPRYRVPHRAEYAVAVVVCALVLAADVRGAIGFSSFGVLLYYAVANAAAFTQPPEHRRWPRALQVAGAAGCLLLVVTLPWPAVLPGVAVFAVGAGYRAVRLRRARA